ncbi:Ankyrin repeat domain-containing protein 50 [Globisporangium polare]
MGVCSESIRVASAGEQQQAAQNPERAWFEAAEAGDIDAMKVLLALKPGLIGATVRLQSTMDSSTALQICVWRNFSDAVAWLLDVGGASLEQQDESGATALIIDLERVGIQSLRAFSVLRSCRVDMAKYSRQFAKDRSTYAEMDTSTLEVLLARGANANHSTNTGDTALLLAAGDGLTKHVRLLLAHGADVRARDDKGRTALELASAWGYTDIAQILITAAPDLVGIAGEQALSDGVRHDSPGILALLLVRVAEFQSNEARESLCGRLLHLAVEYDAPACVRFLLLNDRTLVSWQNASEGGQAALELAHHWQRGTILQILLENGASGDPSQG